MLPTYKEPFAPLSYRTSDKLVKDPVKLIAAAPPPPLIAVKAVPKSSDIVGLATEIEVLRAAGIEQALRPVTIRRRELMRFLRVSLDPNYLQSK